MWFVICCVCGGRRRWWCGDVGEWVCDVEGWWVVVCCFFMIVCVDFVSSVVFNCVY